MTISRLASEDFYVKGYIKNPEDACICLKKLEDDFYVINILQKHLQVGSVKYPHIDWTRFNKHFEEANDGI